MFHEVLVNTAQIRGKSTAEFIRPHDCEIFTDLVHNLHRVLGDNVDRGLKRSNTTHEVTDFGLSIYQGRYIHLILD